MRHIDRLLALIETLRGENGCPWDRKQTPASIAAHLSEEVYELMDAIDSGDPADICDELGDVLFLTLFIASIHRQAGLFDIEAAAGRSMEKMTRRHPHVFGDSRADTPDAILKQWSEIKKKEKAGSGKKHIADSVASSLPPMARARRISERAAAAGFDWDDISGPMEKVDEEWREFRDELPESDPGGGKRKEPGDKDRARAAMEFGDVLFSMVNVARFARIDPESALSASVKKFADRLTFMEKTLEKTGERLETVPDQRRHDLWEQAKKRDFSPREY
ncbi:MazG family protein [Candidatus Desulfarcum epimagneticum]|uniref:MazG family protein n=1 Tax=uncultured Desulfobacteraceae bacterium TaxID=218296 RepID=A0A484HIU0_9BACT|nr:MazG family protein [uncultured Desulfobacteraceae bacterium]